MARGRMISKCLSTSERFAALHETAGKMAEFCQSLYPLIVAHADDWGCLPGDVFTVKHLVRPTSPRKPQEFHAALQALHDVQLVTWYEAEGKRYLYVRGWLAHQQLKGHDSDGRKRQFPPPPENTSNSESSAQIRPNPPKSALREEKRREGKGTEENVPALTARDSFAAFWSAYPNKKAKGDAEKAWKAMTPPLTAVLPAIAAQCRSEQWTKDGGRFIPYPATWLRARRWEDDVGPPVKVRALGPVYSNWSEECAELHSGACAKQWDHGMRMREEVVA